MPRESADAIVVLVASVDPASADRPYPIIREDTYRRLQHAAWLFKYWFARPILICGGGQRFDEAMRHALESEGVPESQVWVEVHASSTHEQAVNCHKVLRDRGIGSIALVVDASSMWRAQASFVKLGIGVVPAPIQFYYLNLWWIEFVPTWKAIEMNGITAHELLGLLWYRLRGWI